MKKLSISIAIYASVSFTASALANTDRKIAHTKPTNLDECASETCTDGNLGGFGSSTNGGNKFNNLDPVVYPIDSAHLLDSGLVPGSGVPSIWGSEGAPLPPWGTVVNTTGNCTSNCNNDIAEAQAKVTEAQTKATEAQAKAIEANKNAEVARDRAATANASNAPAANEALVIANAAASDANTAVTTANSEVIAAYAAVATAHAALNDIVKTANPSRFNGWKYLENTQDIIKIWRGGKNGFINLRNDSPDVLSMIGSKNPWRSINQTGFNINALNSFTHTKTGFQLDKVVGGYNEAGFVNKGGNTFALYNEIQDRVSPLNITLEELAYSSQLTLADAMADPIIGSKLSFTPLAAIYSLPFIRSTYYSFSSARKKKLFINELFTLNMAWLSGTSGFNDITLHDFISDPRVRSTFKKMTLAQLADLNVINHLDSTSCPPFMTKAACLNR